MVLSASAFKSGNIAHDFDVYLTCCDSFSGVVGLVSHLSPPTSSIDKICICNVTFLLAGNRKG